MRIFVDFECKNYDDMEYVDIAKKATIDFETIHTEHNIMSELAIKVAELSESPLVFVPFCHTIEGEAFGADIKLGDERFGPRTKSYCCDSVEELLTLKDWDLSTDRLGEVIKSIRLIKTKGHSVAVNVSGPFTILNTLIDPVQIYKAFRKKPELIQGILFKIEDNLLRYIRTLIDVGVDVISFADSSGSLTILGPQIYEKQLNMFVIPFLNKVRTIINKEAVVHLCPKLSYGLIAYDKGRWDNSQVTGETYPHAIINSIGTADFLGETCSKNKTYGVKDKGLKNLVLEI